MQHQLSYSSNAPLGDLTAVTKAATSWGGDVTTGSPAYVFYSSSIVGDPSPLNGGVITEYSALSIPAVWRGVNFLASTLAGMPKQVFRKTGDVRQRDHNHSNNYLLNDEPSGLCTAYVFWETLYAHAVIYGNGYALIDGSALYNLPPDRIIPQRIDGQQWYGVDVGDGKYHPLPDANILHIPGLGYDGQQGYPLIRLMHQALGVSKAAQTFSERFYKSGGLVGGVLETDRPMTPEQLADLRQMVNSGYTGLENSHKWMLLQNGLKARTLGIPPENAQLTETLSQSVLDIARILGVEPFILMDYGRATWGNLESMNTQVVQYSLMPWILKSEAEMNRKLFTAKERRKQGYYVGFNTDALVRGDHSQQIESASKRLAAGLTTPDEERALLDLPPYPDGIGAKPRVAANTVPLQPQPAAIPADPASKQPQNPTDTVKTPQNATGSPPDAFAALRPVLDAACERVELKTTKAFDAKAGKPQPERIVWANVFCEQQSGYVAEALEPVAAAMKAIGGAELPVPIIAQRYGSEIKRRASTGAAKTLAKIITETIADPEAVAPTEDHHESQ